MSEPVRIQRRRTKGWQMPPDAIYVGRPTKWDNPFRVIPGHLTFTHEWAVAEFRKSIEKFPVDTDRLNIWRWNGGRSDMLIVLAGRVRSVLDELRGHHLACWCGDHPCHADVLLELANALA